VLWTQSNNVIYPLDEKWEIILGFEKKGECDRLRTNKFQESIANHKKMGLGPSVEEGSFDFNMAKGRSPRRIRFLCLPGTLDPGPRGAR